MENRDYIKLFQKWFHSRNIYFAGRLGRNSIEPGRDGQSGCDWQYRDMATPF
jgi:hypothetical protein